MGAKLTLVGAGPGDPDLISVKGIKALADADVVLYDALVHPELLNYAPKRSVRIFVGKKKNVCQFRQEDIHNMIVEIAQQGKHVVRLKGGDPFIFGRGHEELELAEKNNIEVEVIPGISSFYSVPELNQIPLTRRGISESFWVITGTTRDHQLSEDIFKAVDSTATVVILMGMSKLAEITSLYQQKGKSHVPVAIIQNGSLDSERSVVGEISDITQKVSEEGLTSPAIIVIGEVVRLYKKNTKNLLDSLSFMA